MTSSSQVRQVEASELTYLDEVHQALSALNEQGECVVWVEVLPRKVSGNGQQELRSFIALPTGK